MKFLKLLSFIPILIALFAISCSKNKYDQVNNPEFLRRKVEFLLYTDKDFSGDHRNISFTVAIKNSSNQVLWDSALATIEVSAIPGYDHRIVIDKEVPNDDNSLLKAGFYYSIENVGYSWHLDSVAPGKVINVVDYNFQ